MNLFILTNSDGSPIADKTASAVTSLTDSTQVDDLGNLVLGDSEPLVIKFTDGTSAPTFAGDATYTLAASLGAVTSDGSSNYAATSSFSTITAGWSGRLALTTTDLIAAINILGGGSNGYGLTAINAGPRGGWLCLQISVTDPSGNSVTYALLRVFVEWRVVASPTTLTPDTYTTTSAFLLGAIHPRTSITGLTGGGAASLDGIVTVNNALPTGYTLLLSYGRVMQVWQLIAGTDAESPSTGVVRPDDYNASTNARIWVQL